MYKSTKMKDIAKISGVSVSTVSRVLNNSSHPVSKEIKEKVLSVAKELDYTPNLIGRQLKTQKNFDIAVFVPTLMNPFYPEVLQGIEWHLSDKKYNVIIYNNYSDPDKEKRNLQNIRERQIRGLLIASSIQKYDKNRIEFLKGLVGSGVKIVAFDQKIEDFDTCSVVFNIEKACSLAVDHLNSLGHSKIAIINSSLTRYSRIKMFQSFKDTLTKYEIEYMNEYYIEPLDEKSQHIKRYEFENGMYQAKQLMSLSNPPTAIFTTNDLTAYGVLYELANLNIRVPEDVSVLGYNNLFYSEIMNPPLTTIDQPLIEMGEEAIKTLIDLMENDKSIIKLIELEPKLIVRKSTGVAKKI